MSNQNLITDAPDSIFQLDYVDIDALTDHSKFVLTWMPTFNMSSYFASITEIATHAEQYVLDPPIIVPVEFLATMSDRNFLTDRTCFGCKHIAL